MLATRSCWPCRHKQAVAAWLTVWLASTILMPGCADSQPHRETIPVEGRLLLDGKPFGPVPSIDFSPVDPGDSENPRPGASGPVAEDGTFRLGTYGEDDGIPEGAYEVTLVPDLVDGQELPAIHPFTIEIKKQEGGTLKLDIDLKSDPTRSPSDPVE